MKLIIQIPCLNEAEALPQTLRDLPRHLPGIASIETLVIDDGSSDGTAQVARAAGVDHLIRFPVNKGLAAAFAAGLDAAIALGADLIVNTDADNQYRGEDIAKLIAPILEGRAEMVIGERLGEGVEEFSSLKNALRHVGSWVVRRLSGTEVRDAASGFRALSREAALRLNVLTDFTYTLETIIQAGKKNLSLVSTPIQTNRARRPSRLFRSLRSYVFRSAKTLVRIYSVYEPLKVLAWLGASLCFVGSLGIGRFLIYFLEGQGTGKIQSLVLSAALAVMGFQALLVAIIADLIGINRRLLEELTYRVRRLESKAPPPQSAKDVL